jgi:hypothetical protein
VRNVAFWAARAGGTRPETAAATPAKERHEKAQGQRPQNEPSVSMILAALIGAASMMGKRQQQGRLRRLVFLSTQIPAGRAETILVDVGTRRPTISLDVSAEDFNWTKRIVGIEAASSIASTSRSSLFFTLT